MKFCMQALLFVAILTTDAFASTLHVGVGQQFANPTQASRAALPGDTVLIHAGTYAGTFWIEGVQGTPAAWITIRGEDRSTVRFVGGTESMHFSDCAYIRIENITITGQTGNGMNIDDAGSFDTPAHDFEIRHVSFVAMNATGNNDFLKLSGLNEFLIEECSFIDGSVGGSGVDMVGCHRGVIRQCNFERLGSNAIQAKGGTQFIIIERNRFIDAGQRALNLGGSTGLQFFRPIDAPFEAADIRVHANLFVRSLAPIAYVGSVRVDVSNNTIIDPERWVVRILQETVDETRFPPCGMGAFRNNIIVMQSTLSSHFNIGSNTDPESFLVQNNLWYMPTNLPRSRPTEALITEVQGIYGVDPLFVSSVDHHLRAGSPAIAAGVIVNGLGSDLDGRPYAVPPSLGAFEWTVASSVAQDGNTPAVSLRRSGTLVTADVPAAIPEAVMQVYDVLGRLIETFSLVPGVHVVNVHQRHVIVWRASTGQHGLFR